MKRDGRIAEQLDATGGVENVKPRSVRVVQDYCRDNPRKGEWTSFADTAVFVIDDFPCGAKRRQANVVGKAGNDRRSKNEKDRMQHLHMLDYTKNADDAPLPIWSSCRLTVGRI